MAVNKNFVIKNGLEVGTDLIIAPTDVNKVGIGSTVPNAKLVVAGDLYATDVKFTGIGTVEGVFDVGTNGSALNVNPSTGVIGINTDTPSSTAAVDIRGQVEIADDLDVAGVGTIATLNATDGTIDTFTAVNVNATGVITATNYYGDGSTLDNTGAVLSAASGTQRVILSSLVSGVMTTAASDGELTYVASTDTLNASKFNGSYLGTLNNAGVSTIGIITDASSIQVTDVYASTLYGNGANITGIDTSGNFAGEYISCQGLVAANPGVVTAVSYDGTHANFTGVVTATSFTGDGSNLTNTGSTLEGITSVERVVTTGINTGSTMVSSGTTSTFTYDPSTDTVFCTNFSGDGANLTNTGATLSAASGTQRVTLTSLTSGTMISASTDGDLTFDATTNTLSAGAFSGTLDGSDLTSGTVANAALTNSTISGVSLGSDLENLTAGSYLTGSDYNGSTARTFAVDATTANTANKVVARDDSGNFSAGTITATLSGTATNATNARVDTDSSTNAERTIVFADGGGGSNRRLKVDGGLSFNPSTNTLTVAEVSGNAATATNADNAGLLDGINSTSFLRSDATDTASSKITFNGGIRLNDNDIAEFGNSADYTIRFNGTHGLHNAASGDIFFQSAGTSKIKFDMSEAAILPQTDNTGDVGTSGNTWNNGNFTNFTVNSTLNVRGAIDLQDNDILRFGSNDDAEFFFDGSDFYLDLNDGGNNFIIRDSTTTRFTFDDAGDFTATGTVTANSFSGDGSNLTGITAGATLSAASGTQRVVLTSLTTGTMTEAATDSGITFAATSNTLTVAGDINNSSDINLKENISVVDNALEIVKELEGVRFDWKKNQKTTLGVIAQDVEKVLPELVDEDEDGMKSVKYNGLIGVLIEAVKELSAEVEDLRSKL